VPAHQTRGGVVYVSPHHQEVRRLTGGRAGAAPAPLSSAVKHHPPRLQPPAPAHPTQHSAHRASNQHGHSPFIAQQEAEQTGDRDRDREGGEASEADDASRAASTVYCDWATLPAAGGAPAGAWLAAYVGSIDPYETASQSPRATKSTSNGHAAATSTPSRSGETPAASPADAGDAAPELGTQQAAAAGSRGAGMEYGHSRSADWHSGRRADPNPPGAQQDTGVGNVVAGRGAPESQHPRHHAGSHRTSASALVEGLLQQGSQGEGQEGQEIMNTVSSTTTSNTSEDNRVSGDSHLEARMTSPHSVLLPEEATDPAQQAESRDSVGSTGDPNHQPQGQRPSATESEPRAPTEVLPGPATTGSRTSDEEKLSPSSPHPPGLCSPPHQHQPQQWPEPQRPRFYSLTPPYPPHNSFPGASGRSCEQGGGGHTMLPRSHSCDPDPQSCEPRSDGSAGGSNDQTALHPAPAHSLSAPLMPGNQTASGPASPLPPAPQQPSVAAWRRQSRQRRVHATVWVPPGFTRHSGPSIAASAPDSPPSSARSLLLPLPTLAGFVPGLTHSGGAGSSGGAFTISISSPAGSPRLVFGGSGMRGPPPARRLHPALRPASVTDILRLASVGSLPSVAEEEGEVGGGGREAAGAEAGSSRIRGGSPLKRSRAAAGAEGDEREEAKDG
jgi:hypothetical protein